MPLTDPELDLLRELLADDPTEDVFVQVGEELVRRALWPEAVTILQGGLAAHPDESEAWAFLARAALEVGDYPLSLEAWASAGPDAQEEAELAKVHILALERSGRLDEARRAIEMYELDHLESDVVIDAVKERIEAPAPVGGRSAADPFVTAALAERYAAMGRPDRAIRMYRRILFHNPGDASIQARLIQLHGQQPSDLTDDLSEELDDPNLVPPDLTMPAPAIGSASVEPAPRRQVRPDSPPPADSVWDRIDEGDSIPPYSHAPATPPTPAPRFERLEKPSGLADFLASARAAERGDFDDPDDPTDVTEPLPGLAAVGLPTPKRRKKRSLLKR